MLAIAGLRLDKGNVLLGAECVEATRKGPSHVAQMFVVESEIIAMQPSPPGTKASPGLPEWKKRMEYDAIDAVVGPLQQLGVVLGKRVGRGHATAPCSAQMILPESPRCCLAVRRRRTSLSRRSPGKGVDSTLAVP